MKLAIDQNPYEIGLKDASELTLGLSVSESATNRKRTRESSALASKSSGFGGNLLGLSKAGKLQANN